jgi:hypothetical protein
MILGAQAESLELLPLHDLRGHGEHSLDRMKHEIADAGGTLLDASPDKLSKQYRGDSPALYDRLQALFTVIDQGSDKLNMPTYDGGLFTPETDSGQFLTTYAIPDRYLALGLDRLTRDVDDRTKALVFIDFKSLGMRHLGSIYEGLLEFNLRIAGRSSPSRRKKGRKSTNLPDRSRNHWRSSIRARSTSKTTSGSARRPAATIRRIISSNTSCGIPLARC